MKRIFYFFSFTIFLFGKPESCRASHIYAADLQYVYDTGLSYIIKLTLYGDCGAERDLFNQLSTARPHIVIWSNNTMLTNTFRLDIVDIKDVSQVCPKEINNTTCISATATLPGVKRFIYQKRFTLPYASAKWRFVFDGELGPKNATQNWQAGRSNNITNIDLYTIMQIEARLDNTTGPNSSPGYTSLPTPYYCANVFQQYNQGAIDSDRDSLSFSLVNAIDFRTQTSVYYTAPFTGAKPMSTIPGGFSFNRYNGQFSFTPDIAQNALVVMNLVEYRAGRIVGTSQREMTFIIRSDCAGEIPSVTPKRVVGAVLTAGNIFNLCRGEKKVEFDIQIDNPDGDTTILVPSGVPTGAVLSLPGNSTPSPSGHFSWVTDTLRPGVYTFFLFVQNNHCPLMNTQTVAFTIKVAEKPTVVAKAISATECLHQAGVRYDIVNGFLPRTISIVNSSGTVIKTFIDSSGSDSGTSIIDSLPVGSYSVIVSCDSGCTGSTSINIVDSGTFKVDNISISMCTGESPLTVDVPPITAGAVVNWYNMNGTPFAGPPVVNPSSVGTYEWYYIQSIKSCTSFPGYVNAVVHPLPHGQIVGEAHEVCYGDKVYLEATGGSRYTWLPEGVVRSDVGGSYAFVLIPITFIVKVTDDNGCSDTVGITYTDIKPCCNFSYPNAFTPNNDGHNDYFRVVTYGNMEYYDLSVFDRWGKLVYRGTDTRSGWDGNSGGQACEVGTYFYYFKARCLIGTYETHQGDVTLIR